MSNTSKVKEGTERRLVHRASSGIEKVTGSLPGSYYYKGHVTTPHGYVSVYSQGFGDDSSIEFTDLAIVIDCIETRRTIARCFQSRYLVTLATRFAEEVAEVEARSR